MMQYIWIIGAAIGLASATLDSNTGGQSKLLYRISIFGLFVFGVGLVLLAT